MAEYCRTYSKKLCTCRHQCYEGWRFEIKCEGCGGWHWVDHEGERIEKREGKWVRVSYRKISGHEEFD